jgi:hypothetical protein
MLGCRGIEVLDDQSEALGGCYCGEIRYAIAGSPEQTLVCHCPDCRRSVGAQSVGWLLLRSEQFTVKAGDPKAFHPSAGVTRTFCARCGTTLTWIGDKQPGRIDVTIGSLDDPNQFPPTRAVYRKHKIAWASEI